MKSYRACTGAMNESRKSGQSARSYKRSRLRILRSQQKFPAKYFAEISLLFFCRPNFEIHQVLVSDRSKPDIAVLNSCTDFLYRAPAALIQCAREAEEQYGLWQCRAVGDSQLFQWSIIRRRTRLTHISRNGRDDMALLRG